MHWMTSPSTLKGQKYSTYTKYIPMRSKFWYVSLYVWPAVFKIPGCWKLEMHWKTSEWPWTFKCQRYHMYLMLRPKFWCYSVWPVIFEIQSFSKIEKSKCTEWPNSAFKHLTVKSTLYALSTYPRSIFFICFTLKPVFFDPPCPNFYPLHSTANLFRYTRLVENRKCTNDPRMKFNP